MLVFVCRKGRATNANKRTFCIIFPWWLIEFRLICLAGSQLLKDMREKRERSKMRQRFWELGGSRMGDAMGIKNENREDEEEGKEEKEKEGGAEGEGEGDEKEKYDYKQDSQFREHLMKQKNEVRKQGL